MLQNPEPTFDDEAALRNFLLGRLSSQLAEPLEAEMLDSEELFERVKIVETELFDDFAAGRLSAADQKAFLSRYNGHAARSRYVFTNTLQARSAATTITSFRPRAARIVLAAAAIAVVAIGLAFVSMRRPELPTATPTQTAQSLEPAPIAVPPLARTISFTITLGGTRASAGRNALSIPADAAHVQLGVRLHPEDVYDRYAIDVRDVRDRSVWQQSDLQATAAPGMRTVQTAIPADRLPGGTYEIAVSGVTGNGPADTLGFQSLEVRREQ
jgi:hypothetical protein